MLISHDLTSFVTQITHEKDKNSCCGRVTILFKCKKAQFKRKTLRSPGVDAVTCLTAPTPCDILQPKKLLIKGSFTNSRFAIGTNFFVERAHLVKVQISLFLSHSCTNNSIIFSRSKYDCLTDYSFVCRHVNALSIENYPSLSLSHTLTHTHVNNLAY